MRIFQEWKESQHFLGRQYDYVWNDDDFQNIDPTRTDSLLGKK